MKTLKLDHHLAELVLSGKKTSTWRLYDDKDISVNDDVVLIDKVNPEQPTTWRNIGIAHIDRVIQKRLGDIGREDYEGHEKFSSQQELIENLRRYYGPEVDSNTPVKIIHFGFERENESQQSYTVKKVGELTEAKLYADGGSRGNPGPSASGYVIMDMKDEIVVKNGTYLGLTTNNQAEYQALKFGMEEAHRLGIASLYVYMDSLLVINQMRGIFKIKNRELWPIHQAVVDLSQQFKHITFQHVPRELNKLADREVNTALDKQLVDNTRTSVK